MSGNESSSIVKKPSGAEYRKRAKEKEKKIENILKHTRKLETFFTSSAERNETVTNAALSPAISCPGFSTADCYVSPSNTSPIVATTPTIYNEDKVLIEEKSSIPSSDPALWQVNDEFRDYVVKNGLQQNEELDFSRSERQYKNQKRFLSKNMFEKKLVNGENVKRSWLVYSESTGHVFCGPCKLYGGTSVFAQSGFNDWKNSNLITDHDNSPDHRKCLGQYVCRGKLLQRLDTQIVKQYNEEITYWRNVLLRVIETIKFLASRGLPFHGQNEIIGSALNGNFLGCIELISKFDPFMAEHLARFGQKGRGSPSYLSSSIIDEFILLLADEVLLSIIGEIKKAKYYSISIDSTPDISHTDQLTFIIRYILPDGEPVERFVTFLPNCGHKGEDMEKAVLATIDKTLELDIKDCRGQSYDNASNMSGQYKGLQSRIRAVNPLAIFVPCAAHSLQLVGSAAAESSDESAAFFTLEQQLYNFFSGSTSRWQILLSKLDEKSTVLKNLSKTRWSARADASKALYSSYEQVLETLNSIGEDENQSKETKIEAKGILEKIKTLETTIMLCFWNSVLVKFQIVSAQLQATSVDLSNVVTLYETLHAYLDTLRNEKEFENFESEAIKRCEVTTYNKDVRRRKKPKFHFDEVKTGHIELEGRRSFIVDNYYAAIDCLKVHLKNRQIIYNTVNTKFGFLWKLHELDDNEFIRSKAKELKQLYATDLEETFAEECVHLAQFLKSDTEAEHSISARTPKGLLQLIKSFNISCMFPNVEIILRIFLTMSVTNCSGERSFSALKRVKNYLRSTLRQQKLAALSLMYIESDFLQTIKFEKIVERFANAKARKKTFV